MLRKIIKLIAKIMVIAGPICVLLVFCAGDAPLTIIGQMIFAGCAATYVGIQLLNLIEMKEKREKKMKAKRRQLAIKLARAMAAVELGR